jgi:hypothetical protein
MDAHLPTVCRGERLGIGLEPAANHPSSRTVVSLMASICSSREARPLIGRRWWMLLCSPCTIEWRMGKSLQTSVWILVQRSFTWPSCRRLLHPAQVPTCAPLSDYLDACTSISAQSSTRCLNSYSMHPPSRPALAPTVPPHSCVSRSFLAAFTAVGQV